MAPVRILIGSLFLVPGTVGEAFASKLEGTAARWAASAAVTVVYLGLLAAFAKFVERRSPRELAVRGAPLEWLVGVALGTALLGMTVALLVLVGAYRVGTGGHAAALLGGVFFFAPHALIEEILLRAMVFKITEEAIGSRVALGVQAALFGAMHLGNPSATLAAGVAIMLEAGLLLAVAYMVTRRIWFAWGIHLGWNFTQGSIFGIRVSGTALTPSLLVSTPSGADALTGGSFGVEASPVAVLVCLVATVLMWRVASRRGAVVGFREQRARLASLRRTK